MYYTRVKTKKQGVFVKKSKILHKYAEKPPAELPTALRIEININHLKHGCFVYFIFSCCKVLRYAVSFLPDRYAPSKHGR